MESSYVSERVLHLRKDTFIRTFGPKGKDGIQLRELDVDFLQYKDSILKDYDFVEVKDRMTIGPGKVRTGHIDIEVTVTYKVLEYDDLYFYLQEYEIAIPATSKIFI